MITSDWPSKMCILQISQNLAQSEDSRKFCQAIYKPLTCQYFIRQTKLLRQSQSVSRSSPCKKLIKKQTKSLQKADHEADQVFAKGLSRSRSGLYKADQVFAKGSSWKRSSLCKHSNMELFQGIYQSHDLYCEYLWLTILHIHSALLIWKTMPWSDSTPMSDALNLHCWHIVHMLFCPHVCVTLQCPFSTA